MMPPFPIRAILFAGFVVLLCVIPTTAPAQPLTYEARVGVMGATSGELPFWMAANEYGTVDPLSSNIITQFGVYRPFVDQKTFDYSLSIDILARASQHSTFNVHQVYGQIQYGSFRLTGGWKKRTSGLVDSTLSMGSMMTSQNANPLPRVSMSTPSFVDVPGTQGYLAFKAYYSHGWFPDDRFVNNPYLHSKYLYLRVLPSQSFVRLYGGLVHNATWAGTHPEFGDLPDGLGDYWIIITNQASDAPDAEPGAAGEALGSSIAIYDFSASVDLFGIQARAYRQFYIETSAGAQFRNPWDGLWGVSLHWADASQLIEGLLWEHLYTKRQSSQTGDPSLDSYDGTRFGHDTYYSNGVYRSGWVFRGRTLGTPLLFSDGIFPGVDNNIVVAHHMGIRGSVARTDYRAIATWSRNYGSRNVCVQADCRRPEGVESQVYLPPLTQWSFLVEASYPVSSQYGLILHTATSIDTGELYDDRFGVSVGLSWNGHIARDR